MNRRHFLTTSFAAPALARVRRSQSDQRFDELSKLVLARMAELHVPGVAFGVVQDGRLLTRGFGVTSVEDPQPITADTVFPIASISKTFCATAVMNLIAAGKMELKAPVRRYLPEFRVQDDKVSNDVQIWHLLTHTPGWEGQLPTNDRGSESLSAFVAGMKDLPQIADPGSVWSYNNAGFGVAGRAIEVVTGKSIHDALNDLVYAPAGLTRAMSRTGEALTYRFALPHRQDGNRTIVIRPFDLPANVTAGGIATTLASLLKYASYHLSEKRLEPMRAPQLKKNSTDDEMGIGWQLRRIQGVMTAAHGGTLGGHCLHLQVVPDRGLAFSILTNHNEGWRLIQDVERATLKTYAGIELSANQLIGHRGVNEAMNAHATPMPRQPELSGYVGTYKRPPLNAAEVRLQNGQLLTGTNTTLTFYARDNAYSTGGGGYVGTPYEFIRQADGSVGWIRINGRIARKDV